MQAAFRWCGLAENAKKCRYLVFDGNTFIPQEGGVTMEGDFEKTTIPCGIKEKSVFLGCDLPMSTEPDKIADFLKTHLKKYLDIITAANYGLSAKLSFYETKVVGMMRWWFQIYHYVNLGTVRDLQAMAWAAMGKWANGTARMSKRIFTSMNGLSVADLRNIYQSVRPDSTVRGLTATDPATNQTMRQIATDPTMFNKKTIVETKELVRIYTPTVHGDEEDAATTLEKSVHNLRELKEARKLQGKKITQDIILDDKKQSRSCEKSRMYEENTPATHTSDCILNTGTLNTFFLLSVIRYMDCRVESNVHATIFLV